MQLKNLLLTAADGAAQEVADTSPPNLGPSIMGIQGYPSHTIPSHTTAFFLGGVGIRGGTLRFP